MPPIVRTWSARGTPEGARRYWEEHFPAAVLPGLNALDGFVAARVLVREDGGRAEVVVETTWASEAAIAGFAGGDLERAVVEPVVHELLDDVDARVVHRAVVLDALA
jgi:heme-degrading monooxygenase HmoA